MPGAYFVGRGESRARCQSIRTAVASINERIAGGGRDIPVWRHSVYGEPDAVVLGAAPITTLDLAALLKANDKRRAR